MHIILGTASKRRREILDFFSLPYECIPSHFDEESIPFKGDPVTYANELALEKGRKLKERYPKSLILTADTVVFKEGVIFNKPKDFAENKVMLSQLQNGWHSVFTAVSAISQNKEISVCDETRVLFHHLSENEIEAYCKVFKPLDKSGGYSIQDAGSLLAKKIDGCFYNVMGLSINALRKLLHEFGIELWDYLKAP